MAGAATLKRKSFFVDEHEIGRARKALGVSTDAEAIRQSVRWMADMEAFWRLMAKSRKSLKPGSFVSP